MEKITTNDRKVTICMECKRKFWYIDPRPGGRPRQKCGVCSTRPPRYPWDFIDDSGEAGSNISDISQSNADISNSLLEELSSSHRVRTDGRGSTVQRRKVVSRRRKKAVSGVEAAESHPKEQSRISKGGNFDQVEGYPLPSPVHREQLYGSYHSQHGRDNGGSVGASEDSALNFSFQLEGGGRARKLQSDGELIRYLKKLEGRLERVERELQHLNGQFIKRGEWIDLSARLDIVEKYMSEMLNKVRNQLETFSKEVHQVAVVPERELTEMFELVRMIKHYLDNS